MIKKLLKNEYNRSVLTLLSGTTIALAIPVVISPILTRLYTPGDFGVLTLFIAITSIFGSIATGRYDLAIVLPEKEEESINLVALSIVIAILLSFFLLLIVVFFHEPILGMLGNKEISIWLYFVPFVVLLIGVFNALNYYNTRMKTYKNIAQVKVYKSITLATIQVLLGFFKFGAVGLISGNIASHLVANGKLAVVLSMDKNLKSKVNKSEMKRLAKKYSNFPKFSMWAILANTLSYQIMNIFISFIYSVTTLGYYSLVERVLGMPLSLIGTSIGQVFFQRASEERNKTGCAKVTFTSTILKLSIIGIPTFAILFFIIEDIVAFVFGEEWRIAGEYAKQLLPLFFIRFITSPVSTSCDIFERQKVILTWQISLLLITLFLFLITFTFKLEIKSFLNLISLFLSGHYLILLLISFHLCRRVVLKDEDITRKNKKYQ